jgi:hypothetical protein
MITAQGAAQNLEAIRLLAMLSAAVVIMFWRAVIKFMIIAIAMVLVSLVAAGALVFLEGIHR